jgi:MFS family permease
MRAAALLFFLTGLVSATWAARLPAIQEGLGLSPGRLALAILALEAGAVLGLPAGGALVGRRGSRAVLRLGFAAYPAALAAAALAPSLWALAASLAAMAFGNSLVDVAMNVQGVELERRAGRPLLARLHSGHAFGVLAGGAAGTAAAAPGIAVEAHFAATAAAALAGGQAAAARLPADPRAVERGDSPGLRERLDRRLGLLGAVAFCAFLLDGAAYAWIAVHVRDAGGAPALAAAAFTAFALALALGRLVADRLTERHGRRRVVRACAAVAVAGIAAALLAPAPAVGLLGWAALGAGIAPIAPAVLGAAPGASRLQAPAAIAAVTTVGYLGSFTGPPLIGALAGPIGLTAALGLMAAAALAAGGLAGPAFRR